VTTWISQRPTTEVADDLAATDRSLPLAGQRLAVKDNIDVVGLSTTAGCPAFAYAPDRSATVVERLVAAGATVVGKTNLDQFATGLVGVRSPYGACESPLAPSHISGGSSSGSAVAVATGEADLALGTDTAGSGRVPAALCGVVGLKPTRGWLSTRGVVPACRSLDCVSVFASDVVRAAEAIEVAAGYDPDDPWSRAAPPDAGGRPARRLGVPSVASLRATCHPLVVEAFASLDLGGFTVVEVDLEPYLAAGALLYGSAFVAERYTAVGAFVDAHAEDVDPIVERIIREAGSIRAHELARDLDVLAGLRRRVDEAWAAVDAIVLPTVPDHPTLAAVAADPLGTNTALGRFTNGTNLLDRCAAAVPAGHRSDGLPFGISVLGPAWSDRSIWSAAAVIAGLPGPPVRDPGAIDLVVCGAHLEGQPLHHQLTSRGARLVARTATAPHYRMHELTTLPPKPGLVRVPPGQGASLEVEVWSLDAASFGTFVAAIPAPLTIGTVELADGTWAKGFLCEPYALAGTTDITHRGGWRAWLDR
jgi:allophanate hydrolase